MADEYGDWLLEERGLRVIEDRQGGPDVPGGFDPNSIRPVGFLKPGESCISGIEMRRRAVEELNAPYGRKLLWWLLNHQDQIPEEWKQATSIVFAGDYDLGDYDLAWVGGNPCILLLLWDEEVWYWKPLLLLGDAWGPYAWVLTPNS